MEGLPPLMGPDSTLDEQLTPRRTNSMEGLPPLMGHDTTLDEWLIPRRTNSREGLPPLMGENSTLERHEMEERRDLRQNNPLGLVHSRIYTGENVSYMESESNSQNIRQTRERNTGSEQEFVFSAVSPQFLLRPRTTESVLLRARAGIHAQESPRAAIQRTQERRQVSIAAEQERISPVMSTQGLLIETTPESVLLQTRALIQAQESPRATVQRIHGRGQESVAAEQERISPVMSTQGLLERTPESLLLQARVGIQAQESPRATVQRIQGRRQESIVAEEERIYPAISSQRLLRERTPESVLLQTRAGIQAQESPRATVQRIHGRGQENFAAEQERLPHVLSSQRLLERTPESVLLQARVGIQAQESPRATVQRIQGRRQESIVAEEERIYPAISSQRLLRERTPESVLLQTRAGIQAQESPRATVQRIQGRRLTNVTVQGSYSPAVQSQVQDQARTSQSVTSQARGSTQTQERPRDRTQARQENTEGNCQIL
ncbi:uncharacterized protein LOC128013690 [Carassius gibelio]|uniref:uncharacterized protein LOC128013690 n=1 Tax=Carassius gibelio TaxID=101364 RepID=UPI002279056D|nr:uncharacterized protein LOC128013690 [Carassius gibelio]XP_052452795.1 uncharacterized protein LOC128013690 [Carassius gibelio]